MATLIVHLLQHMARLIVHLLQHMATLIVHLLQHMAVLIVHVLQHLTTVIVHLIQHLTTLIVSHFLIIFFAQIEGKSIYLRSGKLVADDSFEVYHINRLKEIIGHDMYSQLIFIYAITGSEMTFSVLAEATLSFDRVPTHSPF